MLQSKNLVLEDNNIPSIDPQPDTLRNLIGPEYEYLLKALQKFLPSEFDRKWSSIMLNSVVHTDARCVHTGVDEYWMGVSPDQVLSLTLKQMLDLPNHCSFCAKSYLPNGFNYGWFHKVYRPILDIYTPFLQEDYSSLLKNFYAFSYTDNVNLVQEPQIINRLIEFKILNPLTECTEPLLYCKRGTELSISDLSKGSYLFNGFVIFPLTLTQPTLTTKFIVEEDYLILEPARNKFNYDLKTFTTLLNDYPAKYGLKGIAEIWSTAIRL